MPGRSVALCSVALDSSMPGLMMFLLDLCNMFLVMFLWWSFRFYINVLMSFILLFF